LKKCNIFKRNSRDNRNIKTGLMSKKLLRKLRLKNWKRTLGLLNSPSSPSWWTIANFTLLKTIKKIKLKKITHLKVTLTINSKTKVMLWKLSTKETRRKISFTLKFLKREEAKRIRKRRERETGSRMWIKLKMTTWSIQLTRPNYSMNWKWQFQTSRVTLKLQ